MQVSLFVPIKRQLRAAGGRRREVTEYSSTDPCHKRLLSLPTSFASGIDHPPHDRRNVCGSDRDLRLLG